MITVIMPNKNHSCYIPDAIKSLVNQEYPDWELLILNDKNQRIGNVQLIDQRVKVFDPKIPDNIESVAYLKNLGVLMAKSEYIAFHDADDISMPWRFRLSVDYMYRYNLDILYTDSIALNKDNSRRYLSCYDFDRKLAEKQALATWSTVFVRTSFAKKIQFDMNIGYGDDLVWMLKASNLTRKIMALHVPTVYYRFYTTNFRIPFTRQYKRWKLRRQLENKCYYSDL